MIPPHLKQLVGLHCPLPHLFPLPGARVNDHDDRQGVELVVGAHLGALWTHVVDLKAGAQKTHASKIEMEGCRMQYTQYYTAMMNWH